MTELILPRLGRQTPTKYTYDPDLPSFYDQLTVKKILTEWWGFNFLPWQELVLRQSLAVKGSHFAYQNIGLSVSRQNGKTVGAEGRLACALTVIPENCVYTSWRDDSALVIFNRFLDRIEESLDTRRELHGFFPKLPTRKVKIPAIESVHPITGKPFARVRFATRKGGTGRGKSESLIIIDEAQDLTQGEHDALTHGIATFKNGQIWYIGTPEPAESASVKGVTAAGSSSGIFGSIRKEALAGAPRTAWIEWGVDRMVPKTDRDAWYEANPSLGFDMGDNRGLTEANLEAVLGSDESFAIERLGFWSEQEKNSALEITRWHEQKLTVEEASYFKGGAVSLAVKSDINDERCDIARAVRNSTGEIFTELVVSLDMQHAWHEQAWEVIEPHLKASKCKSITIDGVTAKAQLKTLLEAKGKWRSQGHRFSQGKVTFAGANELANASAALVGFVNEKRVFHIGQPQLDAAIADAGKRQFRAGSGFGFYSISGKTSSNFVEVVALATAEASKAKISEEGSSTSWGEVKSFSQDRAF